MKKWNCNFAIPFSSLHKYIREDSLKMNKFERRRRIISRRPMAVGKENRNRKKIITKIK